MRNTLKIFIVTLIIAFVVGLHTNASDTVIQIDDASKRIEVSETNESYKDSIVTLYIAYPGKAGVEVTAENIGETVMCADQVLVGRDGALNYSYQIGENISSGIYTLFMMVESTAVKSSYEFRFHNNDRRERALALLSENINVKSVLDEYISDIDIDLGLRYNQLSDAHKGYIANNIDVNGDILSELSKKIEASEVYEDMKSSISEQTIDLLAEKRTILGISDTTYYMFDSLSKEQKVKALVVFKGKILNTSAPNELDNALKQSVSQININNSSSNNSSSASGGSYGTGREKVTTSKSVSTVVPVLLEPEQDLKFDDMSGYTWAIEAVNALCDKEVIAGKGNRKFYPGDLVKREEFVKMIVTALELNLTMSDTVFSDVEEDAWYKEYISTAAEKGIVNGIDTNRFGVGEVITRQDMAVMLYRAVNNDSYVEIYPVTTEVNYTDLDDVADYAQEAVTAMCKAKILNGSDGMLLPNNNATRAEAAQIIYNLLYK